MAKFVNTQTTLFNPTVLTRKRNYCSETVSEMQRRILLDRIRQRTIHILRYPLKEENKDVPSQNTQFLRDITKSLPKNMSIPTEGSVNDSERSKTNSNAQSKKSQKAGDSGKSRSSGRSQTSKPSATTTLWNMDICTMLGEELPDITPPPTAPSCPNKEIKTPLPRVIQKTPTMSKVEIKVNLPKKEMKIEPVGVTVEPARGDRYAAYESLVQRLKERGRAEFSSGGPGCASDCRLIGELKPVNLYFNRRLNSLQYIFEYSDAVNKIRVSSGKDRLPRTTSFNFAPSCPVAPHEEDDCAEERLVVVNYHETRLPAIRRDDGVFVRLADINNELMPSKDTRSLQNKCRRLDITMQYCTETEQNMLIHFANSSQTKSRHIIGLDSVQRLLDSLFSTQRRISSNSARH